MNDNDFLPIIGYKEYLINKQGAVISLPKKCWNGKCYFTSKEKRLKISKGSNGYFCVTFRVKPKKYKSETIHRLLAKMFIPKIRGKHFINYKDGNKLNNSLNNLEWCTLRENILHGWRTGLLHGTKSFGSKNHQAKINEKQVLEIRNLKGKEILEETSKKFNLSVSQIWSIQNKISWSHI